MRVVVGISPGLGGSLWGFTQLPGFVTIGVESRPIRAALAKNCHYISDVSWDDPYWLELTPQRADIVVAQCPVRVSTSPLGKLLTPDNKSAAIRFARAFKNFVGTRDPELWCLEVPVSFMDFAVFRSFGGVEVDYADYGLPMHRNRLLLGNFPLPRATRSENNWKVDPEFGHVLQSLVLDDLESGRRISPFQRKHGRRIKASEVRRILGLPDFHSNKAPGVEARIALEHLISDMPPLIGCLLAQEVSNELDKK